MPADDRIVVVLGAARSGTKLLRDVLAASPDARAVPYDVNYVWRLGQEHSAHDVVDPSAMSRQLPAHLLRQFDRMAPGAEPIIVEKTVSNVLRVPYVARALPNARFVYLEREGEDVVESAMRSWRDPVGTTSLRTKMRTFPWRSALGYAVSYGFDLGRRLVDGQHQPLWGPCYPGMRDDVRRLPLVDVCARQWVASRYLFERDREHLGDVEHVHYEELVRDPAVTAARVAQAVGLDARAVGAAAKQMVRPGRVGAAGRSDTDIAEIRAAIARATEQVEEYT